MRDEVAKLSMKWRRSGHRGRHQTIGHRAVVRRVPAGGDRLPASIDVAFDGEQGIDTFDGFDRDRRLVEPREVEELAPQHIASTIGPPLRPAS
jgi:hypothetical protein